jgi:hypothetical protein
MVTTLNTDGNSRHSQTKINRSATVNLGFGGVRRRRTFN